MCIAIYAPPGKRISLAQAENCWNVNPHGAGFVYVKDKQFVFVKELTSFKKWYRLYEDHLPLAAKSPMLIHFRIRTHGDISIANTQPIQVDNETAFIHNGVISCVPDHKHRSDTVMFSRTVLRRFKRGFHINPKILTMIDNVVGNSKLVFLGRDRSVGIIGEKIGHWKDDIWYSNYSHVTYITKKNEGSSPSGWRGCTNQTHLDTVPTRLLAPPTPAPVKAISKIHDNVQLEISDGMACVGCDIEFREGDHWYEYFNKHMACYHCKTQWEDVGVTPTASGVIVGKSADDYWETEMVRSAYGCGI